MPFKAGPPIPLSFLAAEFVLEHLLGSLAIPQGLMVESYVLIALIMMLGFFCGLLGFLIGRAYERSRH